MNRHLLEPFWNPLALAAPQRGSTRLASSYDRRGGNHDWSNYLRIDGSEAVLMEANGPGSICRIWTADPRSGTVRVRLDGSPEPVLQMPFAEFFRMLPLSFGVGGEGEANSELSRTGRLAMGLTSYCPIPFRNHCRITIDPPDDYLYYHVNYVQWPDDTKVSSFDCAGLNATEIARASVAWQAGPPSAPAMRSVRLEPGESVVITRRPGSGAVTGIWIELPGDREAAHLRYLWENLWIYGHFDDDEPRDPSIRAPLGPFFLNFGQKHLPCSAFIGTSGINTGWTRFAMPHAHSAVLSLRNRGILPVTCRVADTWEPLGSGEAQRLFRFRATWHHETPHGPDHRDYGGVACRLLNLDGRDNVELLNARARGHFVGTAFEADMSDAPTDRAACEGDEMFYIDDEPERTLYGTGLEDYLNDAWGIRGYSGPVSGSDAEGTWNGGIRIYGYRLHASDPITFHRHGRFTLEHGTGNNCSGVYRSVAYWYMDPESAHIRAEERRWEELRSD